MHSVTFGQNSDKREYFTPLNPELNPICYLLALLAHHFLHVSRLMVKSLTLRLLMSYICVYIYIYIYIYDISSLRVKCNVQILYLSSTFYNIVTDSQAIRLDYIAVVGKNVFSLMSANLKSIILLREDIKKYKNLFSMLFKIKKRYVFL